MGDALKFKRNEEKVLEEKSLLRSAKAVYDAYKLEAAREGGNFLLKQLVNLIAESPNANHFFDYHKVHAQYLGEILYAVGKMEPIEQEIDNVRMNIDAYVRETGQLLDAVARFPADPLAGIRNPIVLLEIARDAKAAAAYDDILNTYQKAAELALSGLSNAAAQGRAIEQETRRQVQAILDKLNAMTPTIPADQVFIGAAKKKVQFIQLDLMTKVQDSRGRAETAAKRIEPLLDDVRQVDRIGKRR